MGNNALGIRMGLLISPIHYIFGSNHSQYGDIPIWKYTTLGGWFFLLTNQISYFFLQRLESLSWVEIWSKTGVGYLFCNGLELNISDFVGPGMSDYTIQICRGIMDAVMKHN